MKRFLILLALLFSSFTYADTINLHWLNYDGTSYSDSTCVVDSDLILPATAPTRYGYTFTGWKISNYIPIEYIESTRTQWIDTGVVFNGPNAEVILKFASPNFNHSGYYSFAGAQPGWTFIASGYYSGKLCFYHGSIACTQSSETSINITQNTIYVLDMIQKGVSFTYKLNGTEKTLSTPITYTTSPYILFGTSYSTNGTGYELSELRLYYAKIYDNNILVRDLIPVLDLNGIPCMYDKVTEQFYYNQGTGQFIAGPTL